jgi:DNA-binding FrmR family transcriptional regulator
MTSGINKHSTEAFYGCENQIAGRTAVGVDPEVKASNLRRLSRIEGQVRGIQRMVEEDRYCADILMQVSYAQEALRAVARSLMRNRLAHCRAMQSGAGRRKRRKRCMTSFWK